MDIVAKWGCESPKNRCLRVSHGDTLQQEDGMKVDQTWWTLVKNNRDWTKQSEQESCDFKSAEMWAELRKGWLDRDLKSWLKFEKDNTDNTAHVTKLNFKFGQHVFNEENAVFCKALWSNQAKGSVNKQYKQYHSIYLFCHLIL